MIRFGFSPPDGFDKERVFPRSGAEARRFENLFTENMNFRGFTVSQRRNDDNVGQSSTNVEFLRNSVRSKRGRGGGNRNGRSMRGGFDNGGYGNSYGNPNPY